MGGGRAPAPLIPTVEGDPARPPSAYGPGVVIHSATPTCYRSSTTAVTLTAMTHRWAVTTPDAQHHGSADAQWTAWEAAYLAAELLACAGGPRDITIEVDGVPAHFAATDGVPADEFADSIADGRARVVDAYRQAELRDRRGVTP